MFWTIYEARLEGADGPFVENYKPIKATRRLSPRGILYFLAMWSLLTSLINSIINVAFSMESLDPPHEVEENGVDMYVGVIVFFGHLFPMALVAIIWGVHAYTADSSWREFGYFGTKDSVLLALLQQLCLRRFAVVGTRRLVDSGADHRRPCRFHLGGRRLLRLPRDHDAGGLVPHAVVDLRRTLVGAARRVHPVRQRAVERSNGHTCRRIRS